MPRWTLTASGDAPAAQHEELARRAGQLLGLAKFGADASQFSGEGVNGPVHGKAPAPAGGTGSDSEGDDSDE
jgi:hypothetical protein